MQKGIFYIIVSGLSFLVVNFFVKILGEGPEAMILPTSVKIPPHELVFFRSIVSFSITFFLLKRKKIPVLGNNRKWLLIRGTSGMIALTLFFYTIQALPLAIASTIQYLAPIFTILLAIYFSKEKVLPIQWFFIIIAFFGAGMLSFGDKANAVSSHSIPLIWVVLGIVSAFFSGLAYNSIQKLNKSDHTLNIVLYFPMIGIPVMGIWCLFDFEMPVGIAWFYLLIIGIFTQIAQIALTKAYSLASANTIAPFQYLGSIYAMLVGLLIFQEYLSLNAYIGIFCIIFGIIMNLIFKSKIQKI